MKDWLTNDHNLRNRFFEQNQDGSWDCREAAVLGTIWRNIPELFNPFPLVLQCCNRYTSVKVLAMDDLSYLLNNMPSSKQDRYKNIRRLCKICINFRNFYKKVSN